MDYSRFERSRGERAHCTHRQVNRKSFFSGRTLEGRGRGGGGGRPGPGGRLELELELQLKAT